MTTPNTLLLRLSGPMQSWGTSSRLQLRRTDHYPSKSGVLGLVLCSMGVGRKSAPQVLPQLRNLAMGVRIDRPGTLDWDYHTVGAGIGIRQAEGGVKRTATTGEYETLLSRRQYLLDASFLVALHGTEDVVDEVANALREPRWPYFLGRKCCIPSEPVFAGIGCFSGVEEALRAQPFFTGSFVEQREFVDVDAMIEHKEGTPLPPSAVLVYDDPRALHYPSHGPRWITRTRLSVAVSKIQREGKPDARRSRVDYTSEQWRQVRRQRLDHDYELCVFCKQPAEEVHHVTYERAGREQIDDLRSLCRTCHDACTQLEYGTGMSHQRVDPIDPSQRDAILRQIDKIVTQRRVSGRKKLMKATRERPDYFTDTPT